MFRFQKNKKISSARKIFLSFILVTFIFASFTSPISTPKTQAFFHEGIPIISDLLKLQLPQITIPGTSITIDPNKSFGENVVSLISPFLGGVVGFLDPAKPAAAIAQAILVKAKPYVKPFIQNILPKAWKEGANAIKDQVKNLVKTLDQPFLRDIIFPLWELVVGPLDDVIFELVDYVAEEVQQETGTLSGGGPYIPPPQISQIPALANQKPIGALETIDQNGIAGGWARDPDENDRFIDVHFYLDSEAGRGGKFMGSTKANIGDHRFSFQIPQEYFDNKNHYLYAYGIDTSGDGTQNALLTQTQLYFRLLKKPVGFLENVDENGIATGWAVGFHDPNVLIYFYIDGPKGKEKHVDSDYTRFIREDVHVEGIKSKYTGFQRTLPDTYRDGKPHELYAYAESTEKRGELVLLPGSPKRFIMPVIFPVTNDWLVIVPRGGWVQFAIRDLPNKAHNAMATVDGKTIDFNSEQHGSPFFIPPEKHFVHVGQSGLDKTITSTTFRFKLPDWVEIGDRSLLVKNFGVEAGVGYRANFTLRVIPYELPKLVTPNSLHVDSEVEFQLQNVPLNVHFTGSDQNVIIEEVLLGGELGSLKLSVITLEEKGNAVVALKTKIPLEASKIRKGQGTVRLNIRVNTKKRDDEKLMQALIIYSSYYGTTWEGKTKEGKDPILLSECRSSLKPELYFTVYDTQDKEGPAIIKESPFKVAEEGPIVISGKEFLCFGEASISISAEQDGKAFPLDEKNKLWSGWGMKEDILWDGKVAFYGNPDAEWLKKYNDLTFINITIKDNAENSASGTVYLSPFYQVKIDPLGKSELLPGNEIKIWWKGFVLGHKMALKIDGESYRNVYLEKGNSGTFQGLKMNFLEDLAIPSWLSSGTHTLTMEDITDLDENKKPIYKTATTFVIGGAKKEEKKIEETKTNTNTSTTTTTTNTNTSTKKEETPVTPPSAPKVEIYPSTVTAGEKINATMTNFAPLGVLTVELVGSGTATKLSGIADYTDSKGSFNKTFTVPENLSSGTYTFSVKDPNNGKAEATIKIEKKPESVKEEEKTTEPYTPPANTNTSNTNQNTQEVADPIVPEEENTGQTCPAGSTWSPTFQACLEDEPTNDSPYYGLPCPPEGTVPSYMTKGCIP